MASLAGKVALVTGGTGGIGRATALAFAQEGAAVVVAGRRAEQGAETVRLIAAAGGQSLFARTDVSREAEVKALVDATVKAYGRLDYAFNNAGIEQDPTPLPQQTEATFDQVMAINVKGVWACLKYQVPAMLQMGGGAIVNNASIAGLVGMAGVDIYCASKHAVIGLTKCTALAYAKNKVRVNAVCPGAVETDMFERFVEGRDAMRDAVLRLHPIGRAGQPREVADAVVWLCSDKASFITGQALAVDGGFVAA